ncbi:MAG: cyclic nucleotide-binding domain-containing protein [Vampirovibrionales bacterium]|nr:cyclic nucleotide-binding domain-containing protein [Vampirovibrionales bacterium]
MAVSRTYRAGEKIIAEGTFGRETFRVSKGQVVVCKETDEATPFILSEVTEGEVFGEMYMFDQAGFRSATAIAKTDVELLIISREEIESELAQTPQIVRDILYSLNKRLETTTAAFSVFSATRTRWEKNMKRTVLILLSALAIMQAVLLIKTFTP